jgi:hypothetical protein
VRHPVKEIGQGDDLGNKTNRTFGYAPLEVLANRLRDQRAALGAALAELDRQKI